MNTTPTTNTTTLSLHDALPILGRVREALRAGNRPGLGADVEARGNIGYQGAGALIADVSACLDVGRSEEHTSELQSQFHLVCRLLLEKKKLGNLPHARPEAQLQ